MAEVILHGNVAQTVTKHSALLNDISDLVNQLVARKFANQVTGSGGTGMAGCGLAVDASANDVQFDNAIFYTIAGQQYYKAIDAAIDISAECAGAGDTIALSGADAFWLAVDAAGNVDGETSHGAEAAFASEIIALAQYSLSAQLPIAGNCPVAVISVVEGGSGVFTWGTDSITDETEVYYSFHGLPSIESAIASLAAHSTASQIAYGAAVIVLGTGVRVTLTGKAGVAFAGTDTVARGKTGAFLLYALADDVECLVTKGAAYDNLVAAQAAVRDMAVNPLMPLLGVVYVEAKLASFVAGTSVLSSAAYTVTYTRMGPGALQLAQGQGGSGEYAALDSLRYAATGRP